MMTLSDSIHNTEMVYLFVNKFSYGKNMIAKEESAGHPKPKKIYRAIRNTDTDTYRIIYKVENNQVFSTIIEDLQCDDETAGYTSDIKRITLNNILEFDIPEKCLDNLIHWIDTDNDDVKAVVPVGPPNKLVSRNLVAGKQAKESGIPEGAIALDEEIVMFFTLASELRESDPLLFGTIFDVLNYLVSQNKIEVFDTGWMGFDKNHGAGVNVSAAIKKLSLYMSDDRRTNLDEKDLTGAIVDLLTEKGRRSLHDIE